MPQFDPQRSFSVSLITPVYAGPWHLRVILSVALALVPRQIRKDLAERVTAKTQPAKAEIVDRLIAGIDQHFDVEKKPDVPVGPSLASRKVSGEQ